MLRSELIDKAVEGMLAGATPGSTLRDMADLCLHVAEPLIRADEREKWRADLQSLLDELKEGGG